MCNKFDRRTLQILESFDGDIPTDKDFMDLLTLRIKQATADRNVSNEIFGLISLAMDIIDVQKMLWQLT